MIEYDVIQAGEKTNNTNGYLEYEKSMVIDIRIQHAIFETSAWNIYKLEVYPYLY